MKRVDIILIILFIVFFVVGICGNSLYDYIDSKKASDIALKVGSIPILLFAIFYAYRLTLAYDNSMPFWKNLLGFVLLTIIITMFSLSSFTGMLLLINSKIGIQKEYTLKGRISKLHYPEKKKMGNKYSIDIVRNVEGDTITLDAPHNHFLIGKSISLQMHIGALGIMYSKE